MKFLWISFFSLFLLVAFSCDTKQDFEGDQTAYFIRYYGEDGNQEAIDFIANDDGTILLLGNSALPGSQQRVSLTKVDAHGDIIWRKKFGSGLNQQGNAISEYAQDIEPAADGSFWILTNMLRGKDPTNNEDLLDFKVLRITADGVLKDSMEFKNNQGAWKTQRANAITALSTGGFAVTGNSTDEDLYDEPAGLVPPDLEDLFSIGFKSDYSVAWNTVEFSNPRGASLGEHYGSGIKIFEKSPNELYMFSYSDGIYNADTGYESNFNVFTFTANGLPLPIGFFGDPVTDERLASVCKIPNQLGGGFYQLGTSVISGGSGSVGSTDGSLYFSRVTNSLSLQSEGLIQGIPGRFKAVSVSPVLSTEGFIILATESVNPGSTMRLIKVNLNNEVQWSMNFGSFDTNNYGAAARELPDGKILLFGTVELGTQKKMVLAKMNARGEFLN